MDIQQLGEVVVTAAGIEREKKSLGYRLENVSGSKLQQVSEADPLRALQGKVAGVNITGFEWCAWKLNKNNHAWEPFVAWVITSL